MTKSDYNFGIFLLAIAVVTGLIQGIIQLLIGNQVYFQDFFIVWYLVITAVYFTGLAVLAKYFFHKNYKAALYSLLAASIAGLAQVVVVYLMLVERKFDQYYFPALILALFTSLVLGVILIFSKSSERKWLKIAGIFMLISSVFLLILSFWSISTQDGEVLYMIDKTAIWISLAANFVPLLFVLNYQEELKSNLKPKSKTLEYSYGIIGLLFLVAIIAIGFPFIGGSFSANYWQEKNQERADQMVELFDERTFVGSKGDTLKFLLLKPLQFDTTKEYPLVVSLPYGQYHAAAAQVLSEEVNRLKYPSYLFVPFCPEGEGWGGVPNTPVIDELVFEAIESLDETENIDSGRRYITGISRGGYGSWHFITSRPDLFAAAIPVCGEGDTSLASKIRDISVWAFHGEKDKNVPVSGSREMIAAIKAAGGNPKYSEYENEGHNIWYQVSIEPDLWPWLFSQRKE